MSEVKTWTVDSECLIHGGLNEPVDMVLKSDYEDLKQLSDAFYLKQVQLENQNEELKYQLADRSEKYKIAMDKGVDVLSWKLDKAVEALKWIKRDIKFDRLDDVIITKIDETLRELGVE